MSSTNVRTLGPVRRDGTEVSLVGTRCVACGMLSVIPRSGCSRCGSADFTETDLPCDGILWSWTVQQFRPKEPFVGADEPFEPYGVGYVDLGEIIVEARFTTASPDELTIGMPMRLTIIELQPGVDTFAFAPIGGVA